VINQSLGFNDSWPTFSGYSLTWNDTQLAQSTLLSEQQAFITRAWSTDVTSGTPYVPAFDNLVLNRTRALGVYFGGPYREFLNFYNIVVGNSTVSQAQNPGDIKQLNEINNTICQPQAAVYTLNTTYLNGDRSLVYSISNSERQSLSEIYTSVEFDPNVTSGENTTGNWTNDQMNAYAVMNLYAIFDVYLDILGGNNATSYSNYENTTAGSYTLENGTDVDLWSLTDFQRDYLICVHDEQC